MCGGLPHCDLSTSTPSVRLPQVENQGAHPQLIFRLEKSSPKEKQSKLTRKCAHSKTFHILDHPGANTHLVCLPCRTPCMSLD